MYYWEVEVLVVLAFVILNPPGGTGGGMKSLKSWHLPSGPRIQNLCAVRAARFLSIPLIKLACTVNSVLLVSLMVCISSMYPYRLLKDPQEKLHASNGHTKKSFSVRPVLRFRNDFTFDIGSKFPMHCSVKITTGESISLIFFQNMVWSSRFGYFDTTSNARFQTRIDFELLLTKNNPVLPSCWASR